MALGLEMWQLRLAGGSAHGAARPRQSRGDDRPLAEIGMLGRHRPPRPRRILAAPRRERGCGAGTPPALPGGRCEGDGSDAATAAAWAARGGPAGFPYKSGISLRRLVSGSRRLRPSGGGPGGDDLRCLSGRVPHPLRAPPPLRGTVPVLGGGDFLLPPQHRWGITGTHARSGLGSPAPRGGATPGGAIVPRDHPALGLSAKLPRCVTHCPAPRTSSSLGED